jgi:hypothetical protein
VHKFTTHPPLHFLCVGGNRGRLTGKIATLKEEMQRLEKLEARVLETPGQQISLTDPDARSMATSGRGSGMVAHEVTNVGNDRSALAAMATLTKDTLGVDALEVVADRGYFSSLEILKCEEANITVTLPKSLTSSGRLRGRFVKSDFVYRTEDDVYICPAGEPLTHHYTNEERELTLLRYWTGTCLTCLIKGQCTTGRERRITRWETAPPQVSFP